MVNQIPDPNFRYSYDPALQMNPNPVSSMPYNQGQPVLMNPNQPNNPPPALLQPLQTGNARGSSRMPTIEPQRIDMGSEGLIRMGSAMMANSGRGGMQQYAAAGQEYGNIMDYNRAGEAEAFALEEARRAEIQRRMDAQAKSTKSSNSDDEDLATQAYVQLKNAQEALNGLAKYDNVTGIFHYGAQAWDKMTGSERQNVRLQLQTIKVDATLARTAKTKGAISDKEMAIFASDQPGWNEHENIWKVWIGKYIEALNIMHTNLSTGNYPYANGGTGNATGGGDFSFVD